VTGVQELNNWFQCHFY